MTWVYYYYYYLFGLRFQVIASFTFLFLWLVRNVFLLNWITCVVIFLDLYWAMDFIPKSTSVFALQFLFLLSSAERERRDVLVEYVLQTENGSKLYVGCPHQYTLLFEFSHCPVNLAVDSI